MNELANHILYRAHETNSPVTNLQLQKIIYFSLGYLIKNDQEELAKEMFEKAPMEAWLYGPVVPSIYEEYKKYKSSPINSQGIKSEKIDSKINDMIDKMIKMNPFTLVEMSHTHAFWKNHEDDIKSLSVRPRYQFNNLKDTFDA